MPMRLNGWNRIGIVLSILWVLFLAGVGWVSYAKGGGGYFVETIPGQDVSAALGTPDRCIQVDPEPPAKPEGEGYSIFEVLQQGGHHDAQGHYCTDAHFIAGEPARVVRTPDQHRFLWPGWLFCAFVPLVMIWVLAYLLAFCFRWIAAGFRK